MDAVTSPQPPSAAEPVDRSDRSPSLAVSLLIYTALRLLLVAVLTALLSIFMPLIVALLFAFVLQLPLAWVLFGRWRREVNEGMARATATRRAERARLQDALSDPGSDPRDAFAGDPVVDVAPTSAGPTDPATPDLPPRRP